jgi:hypothetical protein
LPLGRCIQLLTRQRSNLQVVVLPYHDLPALVGDERRHCHSRSSPPDPRPIAGSIDGSMARPDLYEQVEWRTAEDGPGGEKNTWRGSGAVFCRWTASSDSSGVIGATGWSFFLWQRVAPLRCKRATREAVLRVSVKRKKKLGEFYFSTSATIRDAHNH